jgi:hypothetical protein
VPREILAHQVHQEAQKTGTQALDFSHLQTSNVLMTLFISFRLLHEHFGTEYDVLVSLIVLIIVL